VLFKTKKTFISEKIILIILISFLKKRTNLFFNDYLKKTLVGDSTFSLFGCMIR